MATDVTQPTPQQSAKEILYGRHDNHEDAQNALGLKAAYKALDIPNDDMRINAPKTTTTTVNNAGAGMMKGALLGTALLVAGVGGTLGLQKALSPATPVAIPTATAPTPQVTVPVPTGITPQAYDAVTYATQPDGSEKEVGRRRATPEEIAAYLKALKGPPKP